jgi:DNA helicase-2/ATP-dependent DNA helicase PcrA
VNIDPVSLTRSLNDPQREAVLHEGGPLVVFAGAGSGKTRVITHRVAHLVAARGVAPWNILAVTFTNKAAAEMRARLSSLLRGVSVSDLWVGTFHATCAKLLRRYADEVGVSRSFTIYDESDQRAMIKRVLSDLSLDEQRFAPKQIAAKIEAAKQELLGPDEVPLDDFWAERFVSIYRAYEARMSAANALDFGDLLYRLVRALERDERLRLELAHRFRHLLIDEFQDTNQVQYRLVRAIGAQHRQITVVGDDDQSIYRWRGADRRNILGFKREFPDAHIVKLEQNYRSTQRIVRAAHAIIRRNVDREPKQLWTDNEEGSKVTVVRCLDEREEAAVIADAVRELRASGRPLSEIALFYRIHAQSRVLEEALRARNVGYRVVGGVRFYDRAEVKDLLAYLRLLANPEDDVSLLRILNVPARGIGKKSVEQLLEQAARSGRGLWHTLEEEARGKGASARRFAAFLDVMRSLKSKRDAGLSLAALGHAAYVDTGYEASLSEQDTAEADARRENVQELIGSMQELVDHQPELELDGFLELVTLQTSADAADDDGDRLTLMTVHAAKGLEFPVVIVSGLEEQTFPYVRQAEAYAEPDAEHLEEERRLAYVAFTRAREQLFLTHADERRIFQDRRPCRPSRFLQELPPDDVRRIRDPEGPSARHAASTSPYGGARSSHGGAGTSHGGAGSSYGGAGPSHAPYGPRAPSSGAYGVGSSASAEVASGSYVDRSEGNDLDGPRVGMPVRHAVFGRGRVVRVKPGEPPRVDVAFDGHAGVKTIQLSYLAPA